MENCVRSRRDKIISSLTLRRLVEIMEMVSVINVLENLFIVIKIDVVEHEWYEKFMQLKNERN
jgi:hypothetical protein